MNWVGDNEAVSPSGGPQLPDNLYLDCYIAHGCSPETCGGQDDVCGVNVLNPWGTASKEVADQVYKCLGCAGSVNCANPKYYNGTVCADGNPCTWGDTCQKGLCVPDPIRSTKCNASDQCHDVGICDTTSGKCGNPAKVDGAACDDGDTCSQGDSCLAGACMSGLPTGTTMVPTGLAATSGQGAVTLTWAASLGATSYSVKRGTVPGGPYTTVASLVSSTTYTDADLPGVNPLYGTATVFYYVVTATSACGESEDSAEVPDAPIATIPPRPRANASKSQAISAG